MTYKAIQKQTTCLSKIIIAIIIATLVQGSSFAQSVAISFSHTCNSVPIKTNEFLYVNNFGTKYQVSQIQYFVSNISIHVKNKCWIGDSAIRYVDIDIPQTLSQTVLFEGNKQEIDSVRFTFGISASQNKSYIFRNQPENRMFWPEVLGGGYHYMKLNIKYINKQDSVALFNCHLGKGQIYSDSSIYATGFIDNNFCVDLPYSAILKKKETTDINIEMNISKWFDFPNAIDFNSYHGIMNKQDIMRMICENGKYAFSIKK